MAMTEIEEGLRGRADDIREHTQSVHGGGA
jgi:hypothetical protein